MAAVPVGVEHQALAEPVLQHRMALTFAARAEGMSVRDVIAGLVKQARG